MQVLYSREPDLSYGW